MALDNHNQAMIYQVDRALPPSSLATTWGFAVVVDHDRRTVTMVCADTFAAMGGCFGQTDTGLITGLALPALSSLQSDGGGGDRDLRRFFSGLQNETGDFAIAGVDLTSGIIWGARSSSSVLPLCYARNGNKMIVSNHDRLAAHLSGSMAIDPMAGLSFLISFIPEEPRTFYADVKRIVAGTWVEFSVGGQQTVRQLSTPLSQIDEVSRPYDELIAEYRRLAVQAVERRIIGDPYVLLSGGIDSVALAVYMRNDLGYSDATALTFRVTGSAFDETPFAAETARAIGMKHEIVDLDLSGDIDLDDMVARTNAPDLGGDCVSALAAKIAPPIPGRSTFVSGQDTRLHTPWLTKAEVFALQKPRVADAMVRMAKVPASFVPDDFASVVNTRKRLAFLLGISPTLSHLFALRLSKTNYMPVYFKPSALAAYVEPYARDIESFVMSEEMSLRRKFNAIVEKTLMRTQVPFDASATMDAAASGGVRLALPYYDGDLANFCASLPWSVVSGYQTGVDGYDASKAKQVNKVFLRKSLERDVPGPILNRNKAVAPAVDVALNKNLRPYLQRVLSEPGGLLDSEIGEHLDKQSLRQTVERHDGHWTADARRLAAPLYQMILLDAIMRGPRG